MTTWAKGDYPLMANLLEPVAQRVVDTARIGRGDTVLDLATGTGNAALLAARKGAEVTGIDFEPVLLRIAEERCQSSGLTVRWLEADLESLPINDGWASTIVSTFGIMYATNHDAAAAELARCLSSGGRTVLASWVPGGFLPAVGSAWSEFLHPQPASSGPPSRWGDVVALSKIVSAHGLEVTSESFEHLLMDFASVDDATEFVVSTAGHVMLEEPRLVKEGKWQGLLSSVRNLIKSSALQTGNGVTLQLDYLLATLGSTPS